eukprot:1800735-Lingulodinium_polyedra.AAC.1
MEQLPIRRALDDTPRGGPSHRRRLAMPGAHQGRHPRRAFGTRRTALSAVLCHPCSCQRGGADAPGRHRA